MARSERLFGGVPDGLRVAKQEEDRVLYVLEVRGVVKEAVIVRNGPATKGAGGDGWYVESWARCDYSELPRSFADSVGLQIWSDSSERPLPTTTIQSWSGPEHCNWQSMTFLYLGKAIYVRDPLPDLADFFVESYDEHARLPADAGDTGFERNGKHLWLVRGQEAGLRGDAKGRGGLAAHHPTTGLRLSESSKTSSIRQDARTAAWPFAWQALPGRGD